MAEEAGTRIDHEERMLNRNEDKAKVAGGVQIVVGCDYGFSLTTVQCSASDIIQLDHGDIMFRLQRMGLLLQNSNVLSQVKFEQIQEMSKHIDKLAMAPVWEARLRRAIGQYSYSDSLDASRMDDELEDYMFTECVVQLELVMWKKATITESAPASFRDYLDFKLWDAQGWKAQRPVVAVPA